MLLNFANVKNATLIEVPPDFDLEGLEIKGKENEEAVLCNNYKTFTLKRLCTSNTFLVVDENASNDVAKPHGIDIANENTPVRDILANLSSYIEATENAGPDIAKLRDIMSRNVYNEGKGVLDEEIQQLRCSKAEVAREMSRLGCICLNGIWYQIDRFDLIEYIEDFIADTFQGDSEFKVCVENWLKCLGHELSFVYKEALLRVDSSMDVTQVNERVEVNLQMSRFANKNNNE